MSLFYIFYLLLHALPVIILLGVKFYATKIPLNLRIALCLFALSYGFIIYSAQFQTWYLDYQLSQFDLDGDGMFGGAELTAEQAEAMRRVVSDTGRTFAPFVGLFFSFFLSLAFYIVLKAFSFVRKRL